MHTESEIAEILREARGTSINAAATKYNVSEAAIYAWHAKFGLSGAEEIKRLRHLKLQHARRHAGIDFEDRFAVLTDALKRAAEIKASTKRELSLVLAHVAQ